MSPTDEPGPTGRPRASRPKRVTPRPLVSSLFLRATPRQAGGGHSREELVALARRSIARGSKSFAAASMLFDRRTRERAHLLYAWCRRCDDIADGQEFGGTLRPDEQDATDRIQAIRAPHRARARRPADRRPGVRRARPGGVRMRADAGDGDRRDRRLRAGCRRQWRPRTEADMMRYCYHVAGAVGVMMARVMGVAGGRP